MWLLFIHFFTMKKVNGFSMSMKKISSGLVVRFFWKSINKKCNEKKDIVTFLSNDSKLSINLAINIRKIIWITVWNKKSISNKRKDKKVTKDLNKQICLFHGWNRGFETLWKVYFMTTHQFWNSGMQLLFYLIVIFLYILN